MALFDRLKPSTRAPIEKPLEAPKRASEPLEASGQGSATPLAPSEPPKPTVEAVKSPASAESEVNHDAVRKYETGQKRNKKYSTEPHDAVRKYPVEPEPNKINSPANKINSAETAGDIKINSLGIKNIPEDNKINSGGLWEKVDLGPPLPSAAPLTKPARTNAQFRSALQEKEQKVIDRLERIVDFGNDKDAVKAGELWLKYSRGLPTQQIELSGRDGAPIQSQSTTVQVKVEPRDPDRLRKIAELLVRTAPLPATPLVSAEKSPAGLLSRGSTEEKQADAAEEELDSLALPSDKAAKR